jgi:hypothetical protein
VVCLRLLQNGYACFKLNADKRIEAVLFTVNGRIVRGDEIFSPDELKSLVALMPGNESNGRSSKGGENKNRQT